MEKNTLVGFALMGAVIIGFGIYNRPSQEEMARAQHYRDSLQAVAAQQEALERAQEAQAEMPVALDSTSSFFQASSGTEQTVTLENEHIKLTISNKGGRISQAVLKDYNDQQRQPLVLFDGEDGSTVGAGQLEADIVGLRLAEDSGDALLEELIADALHVIAVHQAHAGESLDLEDGAQLCQELLCLHVEAGFLLNIHARDH